MIRRVEQRFPVIAASGFTDAGGIPVRIVGVGFFDRPHHQIGRALNNLELHPVLEIDFDVLPAPVPTVTPGANALLNPGFEQGNVEWISSPDVVTSTIFRQGSWGAWLGGYGSTHTDKLYQDVAIPANVTSAQLSFFLRVETEETGNQSYDTLKVQVRSPSGQLLDTAHTICNRSASAQYLTHTRGSHRFPRANGKGLLRGQRGQGKGHVIFLGRSRA